MKAGKTSSSSIRICSSSMARKSRTRASQSGLVLGQVLELVEIGLHIAVLGVERVGVVGAVGLPQRRIDDVLLLVRMLGERIFELHQRWVRVPRLAVRRRLDLVEQGEHRLMLGLERVEPVAGRGGQALHDPCARIGGEPTAAPAIAAPARTPVWPPPKAEGGAGTGVAADPRCGSISAGSGRHCSLLLGPPVNPPDERGPRPRISICWTASVSLRARNEFVLGRRRGRAAWKWLPGTDSNHRPTG